MIAGTPGPRPARWMPILSLIHGLLLLSPGAPVFAQANAVEDLQVFYGDDDFVSIATGRRQEVARAPSVTTVITEDDILASGYTELDELLQTVPGFHVSVSPSGYRPIYTVRGIHSEFNPQVLMLINGVPATHLLFGNRGQAWSGLPVENIKRVEVIRGPGSALYGADAFAGVINVITRGAGDIGGTRVGGRVGSFDRREAWLLHGGELGQTEVALSLQYAGTDGQSRTIDSDAQTEFDRAFGTDASRAPGGVSLDRDRLVASLDLKRQRWRLRLGYRGVRGGTGAGSAQALDPSGDAESDTYTADLTYENADIADNWRVAGRFSYADYQTNSELVLYPEGAAFPDADNPGQLNVFPNGVRGEPEISERHARVDLSADYTGFASHDVRFGVGYHYLDMYDVSDKKNFNSNAFGLPEPVADSGEAEPFNSSHLRKNLYAFVQDEWRLAPDWELTAGLRYDRYSDFGDTLNPRIALVWQTAYNLSTKFMYGRAFRAPSFSELFNVNNPVAQGNDDLDPETIDWYELALDYQPWGNLRTGLNLFYYDWQDVIRFTPDDPDRSVPATARNTGDQTGYGLEFEFRWDINRKLGLSGNYAYQKAEDEETGDDPGFAPRHLAYVRADWRFAPGWALHGQFNGVWNRKRAPGDDRGKIKDYQTVDLTLRHDVGDKGLSVAASVRNLFDADVREPSPSSPAVFLDDDLPLAGRNFYFELRHRF